MILNRGHIISNRYEVIEKIGSGGMAIVYKAKDIKLGREVTVKVLREEYSEDEEFIKRFKIEARAAAGLSHINIVNVYDVGQEEDLNYIVMEYIDGITLKDLINKRAPFDNQEIIGVTMQVAQGLQRAHSNGIVHRDIKPENILVTHKGVVKVADFGIAKAVDSSTMLADTTMGSVYYFSPEQARGGFVDFKSDIYSLGIVMYEMATGRLPFKSDTAVNIALQHINKPLPNIKKYNQNISESLIKIIEKSTEKKSSNRYLDANDLLVDLKMALTNHIGDFVGNNKKENFDKTRSISQEEINVIKKEIQHNTEEVTKKYVPEKNNVINNFKDNKKIEGKDSFKKYKSAEKKVIIAGMITALILIGFASYNKIKEIINSQPKQIVLDELEGKHYKIAENIAKQNNIDFIKLDPEWSEDTEKDHVIKVYYGQDDKGQELTRFDLYEGYSIEVVISQGSNKSKVPDFIKMDLIDVEKEISKTDFEIGKQTYENNDLIPKGYIIKQTPAENTLVEKNSEIDLVISEGPKIKTIRVPNFFNMSETNAVKQAKEYGLDPIIITSSSDEVTKGNVISQTKNVGMELVYGSNITLVVSTGPPEEMEEPSEVIEENLNLKTTTLEIDFQTNENIEQLKLRILEKDSNSVSGKKIFEEIITKENLPFTYEVSGKGTIEYFIYIIEDGIEKHIATKTIDFDEL